MPRERFYEVNKAAYLFPAHSQPASDRDNPEEPVRQWCAYELIRAYGIPVSDIEFERPVRVGSKTYRIDILVSPGRVPRLVVECKEPNHAKAPEGMGQAISYADAQEIQAEFAVYTNGKVWQVKRRIRGKWIAVPDLPTPITGQDGHPIRELLNTVHDFAPLLYKLDETIEGEDAHKFLYAMQTFFSGWNLLTSANNQTLQCATDDLLRVLSVAHADAKYLFSKLDGARHGYELYREEHGFPYPIFPVTGQRSLCIEMQQLHSALLHMVQGTKDIAAPEAFLLRLNAAILEYGQLKQHPTDPYPRIGTSLHQALRDYLTYALAVHLNVTLPDPLDKLAVGDMKGSCHAAWDHLKGPA